MTSANVELVRLIYAAWQRGDFSSVEWADPEMEFVTDYGLERGRSWQGPAGLEEGTRPWMAVWREMRFHAEEYRELDDERLLVLFRFSARGKRSGVELDQMRAEGAHLFRVRNSKVIKLIAYFDRDRALADLGLASEMD